MTVVEMVVLFSIIVLLLAIGIPKVMEGFTKSKMRDEGINTLNVFEAAELAYYARTNRIATLDSLKASSLADPSEYFSFTSDGNGHFTALVRKPIGRLKKGSWISTCVQVTGGIPQISRACSPGDTAFIRRYVPDFF